MTISPWNNYGCQTVNSYPDNNFHISPGWLRDSISFNICSLITKWILYPDLRPINAQLDDVLRHLRQLVNDPPQISTKNEEPTWLKKKKDSEKDKFLRNASRGWQKEKRINGSNETLQNQWNVSIYLVRCSKYKQMNQLNRVKPSIVSKAIQ